MKTLTSLEQKKLRLFYGVAAAFMIAFSLTLNRIPFIRLKSDFFVSWYATRDFLMDGRNLYDPLVNHEVDMIVYGYDYGYGTGFYYPAHLVVLVGPLALLPYPVAHVVWTTAVQLFLFTGLLVVIRAVNWPQTVNQIVWFITLIMLSIPSLQLTIWGQFNTIGVLSLALCYRALRQGKWGQAGLWAIGLTFKPQNSLLALLFLLLWVSSSRDRWRFLAWFFGGAGLLGLLFTLLQPTWAIDFWGSLDRYIPVDSIVDRIWNPHQLTAVLVLLASLALFVRQSRAEADSAAFAACLALSLSVGALIVPIGGMFHVLALMIGLVLLLAHFRQNVPKWYHKVVWGLLFLYAAGWVGFLAGFSVDKHIAWSGLAYTTLLPMAMTGLALPFCLDLKWQKVKV